MGDSATSVLEAHLPWPLQHLGASAPQPLCSACSGPALPWGTQGSMGRITLMAEVPTLGRGTQLPLVLPAFTGLPFSSS